MNMLEDRLRTALRDTGAEITPQSVPPLRLDGARPRAGRAAPAGRRRWAAWLAPLAAAASVAAVFAASLAVSGAFRGHQRAGGVAAAGRDAVPAGVPPYYVQLIGSPLAGHAVVRATATGAVLATVKPLIPHGIFTFVSAAANDRTFVLSAQRFWAIAPGNRGMAAEKRDSTTPAKFFLLRIDPATHRAMLTPLHLPERLQTGQLAGIALSPDASKLALDLRQSIQVITLATGARREWAWPGAGWVGNFKPFGQVLSWTADGRTLEFQQWGEKYGTTAHIRLLDTTAPGNDLRSSRLIATFPNAYRVLTLDAGANTLVTPDGTKVVTPTIVQTQRGKTYPTRLEISEFSTRTGKIVRTLDRFRFSQPGPYQNVLWTDATGGTLIVSDPRGRARASVIGVLSGGKFIPLPGAPQGDQIAW